MTHKITVLVIKGEENVDEGRVCAGIRFRPIQDRNATKVAPKPAVMQVPINNGRCSSADVKQLDALAEPD